MEPEKGANEVDKFFEGLPSEETKKVDIFEEAGQRPPEEGEKPGAETPGEPHKNRRHRRLEEQLQHERELRIAAEAKAEGRSEAERSSKEANAADDTPDKWLRMYGDTPEARQAWALQKELLAGIVQQTKEETIKEMEGRQTAAIEAQRGFEQMIESRLEAIEDEHDVDVTSNAPVARKARREFLELVQQLSPKDEAGNITGYADFDAAWDIYQEKVAAESKDPEAARRKELASRSMQQSGGTDTVEKQPTPGFYGWMKDAGL